MISVAVLAFLLGVRHAVDPDHVLAVSTILSREPRVRRAAVIGALWGIGHALTILVVGGAIVLFGLAVPARAGLTLELAVAVMLIVLGALNLAGIVRWRGEMRAAAHPSADETHAHVHRHGDYVHSHRHGHGPEDHGHREDETPQARVDRRLGGLAGYEILRPVVVGVVHGLAGSAGVALLAAAAVPEPAQALVYLLVLGLGTLAGMLLVTALLALPFTYAARRSLLLNRWGRGLTGALTLVLGLLLAYRIGFVHGLLTGDPG